MSTYEHGSSFRENGGFIGRVIGYINIYWLGGTNLKHDSIRWGGSHGG